MKTLAALIATLAIACGETTDDSKPVEAKPTEGTAPAAVAPPPSAASSSGLTTKIKAARCGEPCLFLVDTPLAKLVETYKAECGGMETTDLGFDNCKRLDVSRNCIYAAHGLVFKHKKWKLFEKKPWYDANPAFQPASISELERANVHELDQRTKACKKGLHISGADYDRVKAWFGALPKADFPQVLLTGDEGMETFDKVTSTQLLEILRGDLKKLRLPSNAVASYDSELPAPIVKALGVPKEAKLRSILVDIDAGTVGDEENPITEGMYVRFVYDDQDKLRALTAYHYLYD